MPFLGMTAMPGVEHEPGRGFFVNYAAATIIVMLMTAVGGLFLSDHSLIMREEDRLDEMKLRLVDGTQVARIVDHLEVMEDHFKRLEDHLSHLDKVEEDGSKERNELRYRINRLDDILHPQPGNPTRDGAHP